MAARLTQSRLWCYTLQMASDREFTLWIGTDKFLTVVPPFPLRKECFQAGHKCHNRHDTTVNWYSESRWKHSWALINIKLSSSQSCRAIQWVAIKSFVLQFLYEAHENMTFYSCYSNHDIDIWLHIMNCNKEYQLCVQLWSSIYIHSSWGWMSW